MATSVAIHVAAIVAFSITIPARPKPMLTPIHYVALVDAPEPVQKQTPKPVEELPPKKVKSEVKVRPEKKQVEQKKPEAPPPKPKKVEEPKPRPEVEKTSEFPDDQEDLQIRTDQPDFDFDYYLASIRKKISSKWRPPPVLGGKERVVVLHFRIWKNGTVLGPAVETSSGVALLDQSAVRAVADAVPLPPLPATYDGPWLGVHLRFVRHD